MPKPNQSTKTLAEALRSGVVIDPSKLREGSIVVIRAFDDILEHTFRITEVWDDCVSGYSLTGPLEGQYGEPEFALIKSVERS